MKTPITILIVDDEEIVRKLIRVALNGTVDAHYLEANDATEASRTARQHEGSIHLLISDVVMPGRVNGAELAAQLSRGRREMKVLLMSGYAPEALAIEQDWYFIQKPFSAVEIRERIGSILSQDRLAA
jgi:DNA-binding NtrC family response regulator